MDIVCCGVVQRSRDTVLYHSTSRIALRARLQHSLPRKRLALCHSQQFCLVPPATPSRHSAVHGRVNDGPSNPLKLQRPISRRIKRPHHLYYCVFARLFETANLETAESPSSAEEDSDEELYTIRHALDADELKAAFKEELVEIQTAIECEGEGESNVYDYAFEITRVERLFNEVAANYVDLLEIILDVHFEYSKDSSERAKFLEIKLKEVDQWCQYLDAAAESTSAVLCRTSTDSEALLQSLHDTINGIRESSQKAINSHSALENCLINTRRPLQLAASKLKQLPQLPTREEKLEQISQCENEYLPEGNEEEVFEHDPEVVDRLFCNHSTISRDQTKSSDFKKDLLIFLRSSRWELKLRQGHIAGGAPRLSGQQLDLYRAQKEQFQQPHRKQVPNTGARNIISSSSIPSFPPPQPQPLAEQPSWSGEQPVAPQNSPAQSGLLGFHQFFALDRSQLHVTMNLASFQDIPAADRGKSAVEEKVGQEPSAQIGSEPKLQTEQEPGKDSSSVQQLLDRINSLEEENESLKTVLPRWETLHFIEDGSNTVIYLAEPAWEIGALGEIALKAHFPITDIEGYLRQNRDIAFVIAKFYHIHYQVKEVQKTVEDKLPLPCPNPTEESIRLQSATMIAAAESFLERLPNFRTDFSQFNVRLPIGAPYLFWYHYRSSSTFENLSTIHRKYMELLCGWIDEHYGAMYDRVQEQLLRNVVSYETIPFLVKPRDVLVSKEAGTWRAQTAASLPYNKNPLEKPPSTPKMTWISTSNSSDPQLGSKWAIQVWSYKYDGKFYRSNSQVEIHLEVSCMQEEVRIEDLNVMPLKYAKDVEPVLRKRGEAFWSCRHRRLVSCEGTSSSNGSYGSSWERFMVDFETYRQMHSDLHSFKRTFPVIDYQKLNALDEETMNNDIPPSEPDIYLFPHSIIGYNLRSKKWVDLKVDQIRDVTWNKLSFEHLVIEPETKTLIRALITNQIALEQGTDIIESKGNGLIILLHGGPGTGKTFTAETVAEMAEKPLFRVTCGDIGTKPEEVEKYLESVLHLGKSWGCVVLLDEADVFLEQRTLTDLERNALVSVFLRVLEYYEGILILTSNRVGTFDEAFKSRIQLALHYENLTKPQRSKIWKNFLNRLKKMDNECDNSVTEPGSRKRKFTEPMGIDFDDLDCYIDELANFEMNGRQIRNAITTARQLAKFEKEDMSYKHLKHVIKVASKFDTYLKRVQDGISDDAVARSEGIR